MKDMLDSYELRARIAPAAIIVMPLTVCLFVAMNVSITAWEKLAGFSTAALILLYSLSFASRSLGRKSEPMLFSNWDGPPTTRFLRWRDSFLNEEIKSKLHKVITQRFNIMLFSPSDEAKDIVEADERIVKAIILVKAFVRMHDPDGIWSKHNAEYGFLRNLFGSRGLWLAFCLIGVVVCTILWISDRSTALQTGLIIELILTVWCVAMEWVYTPQALHDAADRYAESLLSAFLIIQ